MTRCTCRTLGIALDELAQAVDGDTLVWPWQVVQVMALAEELGVQVVIVDRVLDWDWDSSPWRPRTDRTRLD